MNSFFFSKLSICKHEFMVFQNYQSIINSVMSDVLLPHEQQHTRPPCPSPTPGVHPNPCPLSQWCRPTISSSVIPFSSCSQSSPASGSFQMSQLLASGGQSIGVSASIFFFLFYFYTCFNAILPNHPTSLSHRVQKTVLYICVSFAVSHTGLSLPSF